MFIKMFRSLIIDLYVVPEGDNIILKVASDSFIVTITIVSVTKNKSLILSCDDRIRDIKVLGAIYLIKQ